MQASVIPRMLLMAAWPCYEEVGRGHKQASRPNQSAHPGQEKKSTATSPAMQQDSCCLTRVDLERLLYFPMETAINTQTWHFDVVQGKKDCSPSWSNSPLAWRAGGCQWAEEGKVVSTGNQMQGGQLEPCASCRRWESQGQIFAEPPEFAEETERSSFWFWLRRKNERMKWKNERIPAIPPPPADVLRLKERNMNDWWSPAEDRTGRGAAGRNAK